MKKNSDGFVYIKGKFVPLRKAAISVLDMSVLRGYAVFEFLRTYNQEPFGFREHLNRLAKSIKLLGMRGAPSLHSVEKVIRAGVKRFGGDCFIKVIVTGGAGLHLSPGRPELVCVFERGENLSANLYRKGITLMTTRLSRALPEAKSSNYLPGVVAQIDARKKGFDEALYVDRSGRVLEGTSFNVAIIRGGRIISPKRGVLAGVTMERFLLLAPTLGLRVVRRDIRPSELRAADEMISTSTIRELLPVVRVDNIRIGNGRPGKYARMLLEEFRKYATKTKKTKIP